MPRATSDRDGAILVGGEALFHLVLDDAGELRAHAGGGPFNTARTIARLRQRVTYLGRLSTDRFGRTLERLLGEDGVGLETVVHTDQPTTLALAEVGSDGSAQYRFYERATSASGLTAADALAVLPERVSILHVGTLGLTLEPVATAFEAVIEALAGSAMIVVDPNVRPGVIDDGAAYRTRLARVLARTDVLKVSDQDLAWLDPGRPVAEAARALLDAGPKAVLLTRGADGVLVVTAEGDADVPAPPVQVVDTIGAGDAFAGGVVAWWHGRGLDAAALDDAKLVTEAARFGALVAARTCERPGASPPRLEELGLEAASLAG